MLDSVVERTDKFISGRPKAERKAFGQFFTSIETARFMAGLFDYPRKPVIKILDPGAGSGILSATVIDELNRRPETIKKIELTCYETNGDILPLLESNIELMKLYSTIPLSVKIVTENYITTQGNDFSENLLAAKNPLKYDVIIANPPYFKLSKDAPEALSMQNICYGAPNIYFLFAAMSLFNLKEGGEMVYIIPRSWTSGAYFARFRDYLLKEGKLTAIHVFSSRSKVFGKEDVLQETMIIKVRKTQITPEHVKITSSEDSVDFEHITELYAPYHLVVSGTERFVYLVTSQEEIEVMEKVHSFAHPLPEIGLKMKTGLTVDFRNRQLLRNTSGEHAVPLFYAQHLKNGRVVFPIGKENEYITDELPGMVQLNRNYLFVKRFTSKEEQRRLQCAVYLADHYPEYQKISTQNK
ncbi:MAG: Eco57I restriction-modification methylase domain-containing protein, partial [Fusobacteriaceae bacterium]|nr:Eco57I restriction-modification methylase domain-containing protein [Fusobacteriaceae bacterium]